MDNSTTTVTRAQFITIVAEALCATISSYAHTPTTASAPVMHTTVEIDNVKKDIQIGAFIRYDSPEYSMEIFVGFPLELFAKFHEKIFGDKMEELNEETQDLAGEFLNIAFGTVDPRTRTTANRFRSSFPKSLIKAPLDTFLQSMPAKCVAIPMQSNGTNYFAWILPGGTLKHTWGYTKQT